jgi:hypothetical protein
MSEQVIIDQIAAETSMVWQDLSCLRRYCTIGLVATVSDERFRRLRLVISTEDVAPADPGITGVTEIATTVGMTHGSGHHPALR